MKWISKGNLILFVAIAAIGSAGCKKDEAGVAPVPSGPDAPPTPGIVDANGGFNIKVKAEPNTNPLIHRKGDFDKKCVVASASAPFADRDIECMVETEELEGAFWGIDMVLNVPATMCKFVTFKTSYYYGKRGGLGPDSVTVRFDVDGQFVSGAASSTPTNAGTVSFVDGQPRCQFDYSILGEPNCCDGEYTLTKIINFGSTDPDKPQSSTVTPGNPWGGRVHSCVTGSGIDLVTRHPLSAVPMGVIYSAADGQSKSFKVGEKVVELTNNSFWYANHYSSTVPDPYDYPLLPAAYMPPNTDFFQARPYYEWACLDDAEDQIARIRVQIREWNTSAEFALGAAGNPDVGGSEPDWTDPTLPYNDFFDWDDWVASGNGYPGFEK